VSSYHQTLIGSPESANVYDIDSIQLVAVVKRMCEDGLLLDGTKIAGEFSMLIGAVANPYLRPLELNLIGLQKKVEAGARFIQTKAVFDVEAFREWFDAVCHEGITEKAAILAGILPLEDATEAERLCNTYTDCCIPHEVIDRLTAVGERNDQKREGLAICAETINMIKHMHGLSGIHVLSGGKEAVVPELLAASGL
jgi:methylenetetrahydrofolate reductase (NADPH)